MKRLHLLYCLSICACATPVAAAEGVRLGLKAGTLGLGAETTWQPRPWVDFRGGFNLFDYREAGAQSGVNYDATLRLRTLYATANFHTEESPLRFTAGVFVNGNELGLVSRDAGSIELGGTIYTAEEVGTLTGVTAFSEVAPYAGLGFDFGLTDQVGLTFDVGLLVQGDPGVTLEADGTLADDPSFMASLEEERNELDRELEKLKAYPVVSLAVSFDFP